jgi:hypothetical protein
MHAMGISHACNGDTTCMREGSHACKGVALTWMAALGLNVPCDDAPWALDVLWRSVCPLGRLDGWWQRWWWRRSWWSWGRGGGGGRVGGGGGKAL